MLECFQPLLQQRIMKIKETNMENKQRICDLLWFTLQETRYFNDLAGLEYNSKTELVKATFANGCIKYANVACDSGIAMIRDIIKQISQVINK